ncbi:MAG TPA: PAS domain-containing sensor histidine kinase [Oscillatoriaceae cyanobacterium]
MPRQNLRHFLQFSLGMLGLSALLSILSNGGILFDAVQGRLRLLPVEWQMAEFRVGLGLCSLALVMLTTKWMQREYFHPFGRFESLQENLMRLAVERADLGILVVEAGGTPGRSRLIYANPAFGGMLRLKSEEMVGLTLDEVLAMTDDTAAVARLGARTRQGHTARELVRMRRRDGSEIWVEEVVVPLRQDDASDGYRIALMRDVSAQVKREEQLAARQREANDQREAATRLKSSFLSIVSHELKTPLSLIIGYAELLEDKYPHEPLLAGIQDGSRRLARHVNKLLDYSALLSDSLPLFKSQTCLNEVIENVREIARPEFEAHRVVFCVEIEPDLPCVDADMRRLTEVLQELLDNARQATPAGGRVSVWAGRCPQAKGALIEVRDTGHGIPPEALEAIWQPFSALANQDPDRVGGLGLGLAVCRRLIELHGGRIEVENLDAGGTCFRIYLPLSQAGWK